MKNKLLYFFLSFLMAILFLNPIVEAESKRLVIDLSGKDTNQINASQYINYTIQPGDTLYKLALQYGTTIGQLMSLNNIQFSLIYPGQVLKIPYAARKGIIYTVKPGDSLYFISLRYKISIDSIKKANNLSSDLIFVGQQLVIPLAGDYSGENNSGKGEENSYKALRGKVNISNKTRNSSLVSQEAEVEKSTFPLFEYGEKEEFIVNEIIVKYKAVINSQSLVEFEEKEELMNISSVNSPEGRIVKYQIPEGVDPLELAAEYKEKEEVLWAEPNYIYYPTAIPQDQYYNQYQWDMVNINMEAAWDITKGDRFVIVAVLDTGIIPNHPDLKANLLPGVDFVGGSKSASTRSYIITDNDPTDETPQAQGGSHGTHVAGIIGAVTNNQIGVAGVNWQVKILPIRALTRFGGTSWDIAEGIYYAIDQGVDIINMSFGGNYDSYYQREAIRDAVASGITIIAATGNENSAVYYPAAYPETIAVAAVGRNNSKTAYSNYGPEVDIAAPGGNYGESILSTWGYYQDGYTIPNYAGMVGTSMAAPHVSGVAALLVASGVNDPKEIRARLLNNARDLGREGRDEYYGYGLLDAYGALLNKKIEKPYVFAAVKRANSLEARSEITRAAEDGSFLLERVPEDADYLIAWFDSNNNKLIDGGDYYGELRNNSNLTNITINLSYLSRDFQVPYYQLSK